jgi:hypothetical protein
MNNKELIKQLQSKLEEKSNLYLYEKKQLLKYIPDFITEIFEEDEKSFFIAGGAITSIFTEKEVNDIDIYPKTMEALIKLIGSLYRNSTIFSCTDKSIFLNHSGYNLNIIYMEEYKSAEQIFDLFDFTIVMGAYDFDSEEFIFHPKFFRDLAKKRIVINHKTRFPLVSILRTNKYKDRGYKLSKNEFTKLLLRATELEIKTKEDFQTQLGGLYGINIDDLLDGRGFSLELMYELLSNIPNDFDKNKSRDISLNLELLDKIREFATKFLKDSNLVYYNGIYLKKIGDNEFINREDIFFEKLENITEIDDNLRPDYVPKKEDFIILGKNVKLEDDKLYSYYSENFEYVLNETIKPNGEYLWFYTLDQVKTGKYSKSDKSVLLKAKVYLKDFPSMWYGDEIKVKKCIPIEYIKRDK